MHIWHIDNFENLCAEDEEEFPHAHSSDFSPVNSEVQFYLELFPKGDDDDTKDHLSMYLCVDEETNSGNNKIPAIYKISILNNKGVKSNILGKYNAY